MINIGKRKISLSFQRSFDINKYTKKILCEVNVRDFNNKDIKTAAIELFSNRVKIIESSIRKVSDDFVTMIVTSNKLSRPYKKEKYKSIASNIVADILDNTLWEIVSVNGEKRLILKDDQNFDKIFENSSRMKTFAFAFKPVEASVDDYVSYYSTSSGNISSGYVIQSSNDSVLIINKYLNKYKVKSNAIIDVADLTESNMKPNVASLTKLEASKVLDYYKILYKNTEFFRELDRLVGVDVLNSSGKYTDTLVTSSSVLDGDFSEIKDKIKDFLVDLSIKEIEDALESEATETSAEDVGDVVEDLSGNTDGDFEIENSAEEDFIDNDESNQDSELLSPEDLTITTESELDDGEFEDKDIDEMSDEELIEELSKVYK